MRVALVCLACGFCAVLVGSCTFASIEPPETPFPAASVCRVHSEQSGLVLGIEPFDDQARLETYFGLDVLRLQGILPVLVSVENGAGNAFLVEKARMRLEVDPSVSTGQAGQDVVAQDLLALDSIGERIVFNSLPLGDQVMAALSGTSLLWTWNETERHREAFEYNVKSSLWLDRTVPGGGVHRGFVYYDVSGAPRGVPLAVRIDAQAMPAGDVVTFILPFMISPDRLPGGAK